MKNQFVRPASIFLLLLWLPLSAQVSETLTPMGLENPYEKVYFRTAGDLDGDARKDYILIGTDVRTSTLYWSRNTSDDAVYVPIKIASGEDISQVTVSDVDRDGDQDVLYVMRENFEERRIYWSENLDGDGLRWEQREMAYEMNSRPLMSSPKLGDLNGDGYPDLVHQNEDSLSFALALPGGFSVSHSLVYFDTVSISEYYLADVTGDGASDIVYFPFDTDYERLLTYRSFTGDGTNGFGPSVTLGRISGRIQTPFDYDSDGRVDAVTNNLRGGLNIYRTRDGGYEMTVLPIDVYDVAAVDLTGDGQNDILFADYYEGMSYIPVLDGVAGAARPVGERTGKYGLPEIQETAPGHVEVVSRFFTPGLGVLPGRMSLEAYLTTDDPGPPIWYPLDFGTVGVEPPRPGEWSTFVTSNHQGYPWVLYRISPEDPHDNVWYTVTPVWRPAENNNDNPDGVSRTRVQQADINGDGYPDFQCGIRSNTLESYLPLVVLSGGRPGVYRQVEFPPTADSLKGKFAVVLSPPDRYPISVEFEYSYDNYVLNLQHHYDADGIPDRVQMIELGTGAYVSRRGLSMPDLNHDGYADLVIGQEGGTITYLPYDPARREFGQGTPIGLPGISFLNFAAGDIDGDSFADLAVLSESSRVLLFTGLDDGQPKLDQTLVELPWITWNSAAGLVMADTDGNGRDELVHIGDRGLFVAGLSAAGDWWEEYHAADLAQLDLERDMSWEINTVADVDGDGDDDILFHDRRLLFLPNLARDASYRIATYYDGNGNGAREAAEPLLPGVGYTFRDSPVSVRRDDPDGWTTLFTNGSGETQLTADIGPLWKIRPGAIDVNLGVRAKARRNLFAAVPTSDVHRAELSLTAGRMRCNTDVPVWITLKNTGNQIVPASYIAFSSDPGLMVITPPDSVAEGRSFYRTDSLLPGTSIVLPLMVEAPGVDVLPLTVKLRAAFDHRTGTATHQLEALEYAEVRCSYDPNDKQVSPRGIKEPGFLRDSPELTYTIRFQNTGNDTAYLVVLRDTIDTELDLASFVLESNSHRVSVEIEDSTRALAFRFSDIMLVDSMTNPPASQGFVTYKLTPRADVVNNDEITNRAAIYFDYNPPIITNTVLNTMVRAEVSTSVAPTVFSELDISVAPNPAGAIARLYLGGSGWDEQLRGPLTARLASPDGRTVRDWVLTGRETSLELRGLPPGIFVLSVYSKIGIVARTQLAVQP